VSELVERLVWLVVAANLPNPIREFRFHPTRRFRFDLAWPNRMIAAEVDGGTWVGGRHTTGAGFEKDAEKMSEAAVLGWRVLRITKGMIESGKALDLIERALA
jgi:very-short-patch-repair endonuclease